MIALAAQDCYAVPGAGSGPDKRHRTMERRDDLESLLRAANAGDGRAFARFLMAVTPAIRRIVTARGQGLPPDQHEDIVQDVLLALHLKRGTWDPAQPVRPWLYAVARHKVVDAFRRRGRRLDLPIEDFAEILPAEDGPDPLAAHEAAGMLARIDARSARIVREIELEERSTGEVGARLGLTEGAVRVALHRALKRLGEIGQGMMR